MLMKHLLSTAAVALLAISCHNTTETAIYLDEKRPHEARMEEALIHTP